MAFKRKFSSFQKKLNTNVPLQIKKLKKTISRKLQKNGSMTNKEFW